MSKKKAEKPEKPKALHNVVNVEITTYRGISLDAVHFYASLSFYDPDDKYHREQLRRPLSTKEAKALNKKDRCDSFCLYRAGEMTDRFDAVEDIHLRAIEVFKDVAPHTKFLTCGPGALLEPKLVLVGPKKYKDRVNELAKRGEELEWRDDEVELQAICDEFDALNEKYNVHR